MKTAKELVEELEAEDKLIARGWVRYLCDACGGAGAYMTSRYTQKCGVCEGTGFTWKPGPKQPPIFETI